MSLSNPQIKNPATRFIRWRGGAEQIVEKTADGKKTKRYEGGKLTWYDKEAEEEKEIALPFGFIVLDELDTLTGFNEGQQSGYWSNEVRSNSNGTLIARTKQGIQARGTYQQIKEKGLSGLKYAKSVYIAFKDEEGELQLGNIQMAGSALTAWIEFQKKFDVSQCAVFVTDEPKLVKKGTNYYFQPVFDGQNMSEATKAEAVVLDEQLQAYLNSYFQRKSDLDDGGREEVDDEPTYATSAEELNSKPKADVEIEDLDATGDPDADEDEAPAEPAKSKKVPGAVRDVEF